MKRKVVVILTTLLFQLLFSLKINAINLDNCNIKDIENALKIDCSNVQQLDIKSLSRATNAKEIVLRNTNLDEIPHSILTLDKLEKLDLSYNNIRTIDFGSSNLQNLKELKITNNQLDSFGAKINKLKKLERLDISYNSLFYIDKSIEDLYSLQYLNASNNAINSIPNLKRLEKLKQLDLHNNFIVNVDNIKESYIQNINVSNNLILTRNVKNRVSTFDIVNQSKIVHLENYQKVVQNALEIENGLKNNMRLKDGRVPVGFKRYYLSEFKDENGNIVKLSDYISSDYKKILKSGKIESKVFLLNQNNDSFDTGGSIKLNLLVENSNSNVVNHIGEQSENANILENLIVQNIIGKENNTNIQNIVNMIDNGEDSSNQLYGSNFVFLLKVLVLLLLIIPLICIVYFLYKSNRVSKDLNMLN